MLFIRLCKWIGGLIFVGAALVGVAAIVYLLVLDPPVRQQLLTNVAQFDQHLAQFDQLRIQSDRRRAWQTPVGRELIPARAQHFSIAVAVTRCSPDVDLTGNLPATIVASLMLGLEPTGELMWPNDEERLATAPKPRLELNNYQASIFVLSDAISRARMQIAGIVVDSKAKMELYQWTLIILGAITTILVSIKSMSSERTPVFVAIGILAIITSALGTACSGIISFYSPNDTYVRSERALLQLRQLHTDLSFEVASAVALCEPIKSESPDDLRTKRLRDLSTRLTEILNASGTGTSVQNPTGSTSSPGGVGAGALKSK
jgi:hypothetical protein